MTKTVAGRLRFAARRAATYDGQFDLCAAYLALIVLRFIAGECRAPAVALVAIDVPGIAVAALGLAGLSVLLLREARKPRPDARS